MRKADECTCEPATEQELNRRFEEVLAEYTSKPGSLIPVLQIAQTMFGYLPEHVLKRISTVLNKSYSEVSGVVGFYSFFSTTPRGKNLVRVCLGTACYVRGGNEVLSAIKHELEIDVGQTTPDKQFTLDIGRCFGACGLAPVIMINDTVHQRVKAAKVGELLAQYRSGSKKEKKS
jgi:NADH:ubiquinone oxidoreductase subunit E